MNRDGGRLNYGVGLDNSQLRVGAAESKRILGSISSSAVEEGKKIDETFSKIGQAAAGVFAASMMKEYISQVVKVRGEFQKLELAFETMLGSKAQSDALMAQLVKTAAITPFGVSDITEGAKQLLAFGIQADEVNETLIRLGDISAGLSIPLGDLVYLYGTTKTQGQLFTQDLRQFMSRGIPLAEELSKQLGVTTKRVQELVSEGKIGFNEVQNAIIAMTDEGSKFGGLMEAQSKTLTGKWSAIEDQIEQMVNTIGQKSEGMLNESLDLISSLIENWETIGKVLLTVISTYGAYRAAVLTVAAAHKVMAIWGTVQAFFALIPAVRSAKDAMLLFNMVCKANPLGIVISVLAAAASAFYLFKNNADEATDAAAAQRKEIAEFNRQVGESVGRVISEYKKLQKEYKDCKTAHEKDAWIKENKRRFTELGISVNDVNTAENIFVKNTQLMLTAFKKRAEAAAWQTKIDALYSQRITRQLELEQKIDAVNTYTPVQASSHTSVGGYEEVGRDGHWYYTQKGVEKRKNELRQSMKNDPLLNAIDAKIDDYTNRVASLTADFQGMFKSAGSNPEVEQSQSEKDKAAREKQRIADETAQRKEKIKEYAEEVKRGVEEAELDIRQAQINALEDGYAKTVQQVNLNYDRMIAENKAREIEMIEAFKDTKVLEWKNANPKATKEEEVAFRESLNLTRADLSKGEQATLEQYEKLAAEIQVKGHKEALKTMLEDYQAYEDRRHVITEKFAKARNELYETDENGNVTNKLRNGVKQENVDELNRQEQEALTAVDEEFAARSETFQVWCDEIADMTLKRLKEVLDIAKAELKNLEENGGSGQDMAVARAKVTRAEKAVEQEEAKTKSDPKRSLKEWEDLYQTLLDCEDAFQDLGDAVGGTVGDIISSAGTIATSTLSMINGIVQLVNMSNAGMTASATTASKAVKTVEKASVVLAIISAALQVATAIANLFNKDEDKQEEIDALQGRIDQLQWELDNADAMRLQDSGMGKSVDLINQKLNETRLALFSSSVEAGNFSSALNALSAKVSKDNGLMKQSAEEIAKAYANVSYSANKALGEAKYSEAKSQLENIAQQQLLIQEQIDTENSKKDADSEQVKEWENKIEELGAEAVEIINGLTEDIMGGSSTEIASELSDAFFEAFKNGEDYAQAWGDKVDEIIGNILRRMLVSKFLEEPLGAIFDKYKSQWFKDGEFVGIDGVINSLGNLKEDLNDVGGAFTAIWDALPEDIKNLMGEITDATRTATQKGVAQASQETVDELNGRATAIQGHTYSISENTKLLLSAANSILQSVLQIERHTEDMAGQLKDVKTHVKEVKDTVNDIALKGVKMK